MRYLVIAIALFATIFPGFVFAQETEVPSTVEVRAVVESVESIGDDRQIVNARVITEGEHMDSVFEVDSADGLVMGLRYRVNEGQKVVLAVTSIPGEGEIVYLTDVVRSSSLWWVLALFILVVLAVGRWRGLTSLLSLVVIAGVLFAFILPLILKGASPILVTIAGSAIILAFSIFVTHGFKKTSLAAFLGTIAGLVITGILALVFVDWAQLTGLGLEEAALLQLELGAALNVKGLLLSAIIIGAVGVLDDMAVNQVQTVIELKRANPELSSGELVKRAMRVGRHHIASVVNTLVLAYAGASLPLLLLFVASDVGTSSLINSEVVAGEIVRTLVGTIGLVLTVPIATVIASYMKLKK